MEPSAREQDLRDFLGGFGFSGEQALARVASFSGGERSRLGLALIVRRRPNLLLLDEPTNHLDLEMRHALTLALQEFDGAVVLVSHDRHLIRTTADDLWLVADGRALPFEGDLEDYRIWLQAQAAAASATSEPRSSRKEERRSRARRQDEVAAKRRPMQTEAGNLEREIEALAAESARIDRELIEAARGRIDGNAISGMQRRRAPIEAQVWELESRWYALQEALSALDAQ
jgi:ATP-binding cassette subfamily F protein 3